DAEGEKRTGCAGLAGSKRFLQGLSRGLTVALGDREGGAPSSQRLLASGVDDRADSDAGRPIAGQVRKGPGQSLGGAIFFENEGSQEGTEGIALLHFGACTAERQRSPPVERSKGQGLEQRLRASGIAEQQPSLGASQDGFATVPHDAREPQLCASAVARGQVQ